MELYIGYILAGFFLITTIILFLKGGSKESVDNRNDLENRLNDLLNKINELEGQKTKVDQENLNLLSEKSNLEKEIASTVDENLKLTEILEHQKIMYNNKVESNQDDVVQLGNMQSALIDKNAEIDDLNRQLSILKTANEKYSLESGEILKLKSEISETQTEKIKLLQAHSEANDLISVLEEKIRGYTDEISSLVSLMATKENEFSNLSSFNKETILKLESKISELEAESKIAISDSLSSKNILIVDDSIVIRTKLNSFLKNNGFIVTQANDGSEALNLLKNEPNKFSMVITDLEMPVLNGYELIEKISSEESLRGLPVYALTGHDQITVEVDKSNSFCGISKKPWNDNTLLIKINELAR